MTETAKRPLYVPHAGPSLLEMPLLNKGSAFSTQERIDFNLQGLLPHNIETIEEQTERAYSQYNLCNTDLDRHIFLRSIQDNNETLFFRLLEEHLEEMMPIIYTPTVGQACQEFSKIYRTHRGLFISYPDRERIDDILRSATKNNVKIVVVTDSERILGLGDQGIGGMGIPIGKLSLYTACGGISPAYTLPVVLDVGTNNPDLLNDPMYMGWRHERVSGAQYEEFVDLFIQAIKRRWPNVLLQFEDFAQTNAMPLLERYKDEPVLLQRRHPGHRRGGRGHPAGGLQGQGREAQRADRDLRRRRLRRLRHRRTDHRRHATGGPGRGPGASAHLHGRPLGPAHRRHEQPARLPAPPGAEARRSRCLGRPAGRRPGVAGSDPQCPADGADRRLRAARAVFRRGHP